MATDIRPIEILKNGLRNGKMTKQEAIKACERAMWNLDERNASYVINMRDVASQVEIAQAAERWMYPYKRGVEVPTFFDSFVMFRFRLMWLLAKPQAAESSDSANGSPVSTPNGDGLETCGRCGGSGIYAYGGIVNGKPVGGTCFRCKGKGRCTRYANELGERGRLEAGTSAFVADINRAKQELTEAMYEANNELINEYEAKKAETEANRPGTVKFACEDCSKEIDGGQWCADCAKARYYIDEKGRGKFRRGPKPSHDEIIGREWESAVTPTARRRAERKASYATGGARA